MPLLDKYLGQLDEGGEEKLEQIKEEAKKAKERALAKKKESQAIKGEVVEVMDTMLAKKDGKVIRSNVYYTRELGQEVLSWISKGNSINDACKIVGVTFDAYKKWIKKYPTFAREAEQAEALCKSYHIENIQKASERNWQASAWYLERRYNDEYGQRARGAGDEKGEDKTLNVRLIIKDK